MSTKTEMEMLENIVGSIGDIQTKVQRAEEGSAKVEEIKAQLDTALEDLDAQKDRLDAFETANKRIETEVDEVEVAKVEHKAAFKNFLLTNDTAGLHEMEAKLLSVGSDPDGGYVVSDDMSSTILSTIYETSAMRNIASVHNTAKNTVKFLVDKDEAGAQWTAEQGTNTNAATPEFGELEILVHKMSTEPAMTTEMLQDADLDIEAWLAAKVADKFGRVENESFVNGAGVFEPRGFTTYDAGTGWGQIEQIEGATSSVLDEIDLLSLMDSLKDGYRSNASWAMSRRTNTVIRKLQDSNGAFLFTGQDLMEGTLWGFNIQRMEDMVKPTSGVTYADSVEPVAFGDFRTGYTIVDRLGVNVIRDPFTSKGYVKYYTTRRVGGAVTNFEAIKLLTIKNA